MLRSDDETIEINRTAAPHTVEQINEILGCKVACGAWGIRAAAESTEGRIEGSNAFVQSGDDVGERRASRVVKVER